MTKTLLMVAAGVLAAGSLAGLATGQGSAVQAAAIKNVPKATHGAWHQAPKRKPWAIRGVARKDIASALQLSPSALKKDLAQGETLDAIATKQGMPPQTVASTLENDAKKALARAVSAKRISSQKASQIEAHMPQRIQALMTRRNLKRPFSHPVRSIDRRLLQEASQALKTQPATLRADLKSGKTLAEIAGSRSAVTTLQQTLISDTRARIQKAVASDQLTQTVAAAREKSLAVRVSHLVYQRHPLTHWARPHRRFRWMRGIMGTAAKQLGLTPTALKSDLARGQTLATLAAKTPGGVHGLESTLTNVVVSRIQSRAKEGHINAHRLSSLEAHMSRMIDHMVTHSVFMQHAGWAKTSTH